MVKPRFQYPISVVASPDFPKFLDSFGSSCDVFVSKDGQRVLKAAHQYDCTGFDDEVVKNYAGLAEQSVELLDREKDIYKRLGTHEGLLPFQITDLGLIFPLIPKGDLRRVLRSESFSPAQKRIWMESIVETLVYAHKKGVLVSDISTRNVLVKDDGTLLLCDFSGSGLDSHEPLIRAERRYQKFEGSEPLANSMDTEIFAIGSLLYEISAGKRPYDEVEDDEVEEMYLKKLYPALDDIQLGGVIGKCWHGEFKDSSEVLQAIKASSV